MTSWWLLVAVGLAGLAGCGGDGGEEALGSTVESYCEVSAKLDEASDRLIGTEADTPEEITKGFAQLFEDFGQDLEDLVAVAPAKIKADVAKGVEAFRKASVGDFSAMESFDETRISDFDAKNCK
ncbi:MAG: hypothetical protein ACRD0O_04545 [Acidimicrobiia bacterium]